jgi:hypothetical protein
VGPAEREDADDGVVQARGGSKWVMRVSFKGSAR